MTVLVGLLCKDGVVLGSDSSCTFASDIRTIEQSTKKVHTVKGMALMAGTGEVGLGQRFLYVLENLLAGKELSGISDHREIGRVVAEKTLHNFSSTQCPRGTFGGLFGFYLGSKFGLCEFSTQSFQPELKMDGVWFASMGSGQNIADPFLGFLRKTFWEKEQPNVKDGVFYVTWALKHVIDLNTGGIAGPIQLATLTRPHSTAEAKIMEAVELDEHIGNVDGIHSYLSEYRGMLEGKTNGEAPPSG